jgi:hypothetical protein
VCPGGGIYWVITYVKSIPGAVWKVGKKSAEKAQGKVSEGIVGAKKKAIELSGTIQQGVGPTLGKASKKLPKVCIRHQSQSGER